MYKSPAIVVEIVSMITCKLAIFLVGPSGVELFHLDSTTTSSQIKRYHAVEELTDFGQ